MAIIDLKYATIELADAASNLLVVEVGTGTLDFTENRNIEIVKRRGLLETAREGDEQEMSVSFQFVWELLTAPDSDDPPTVEDVLKHRGVAAGWVSTNPDPDAPFCVDIRVTYFPPCPLDAEQAQVLVLPRFQYDELAHAIKDGTIDCKGKCLATQAAEAVVAGVVATGPGGRAGPGTGGPTQTAAPTPNGVPVILAGVGAATWGLHNDLVGAAGFTSRQLVAGQRVSLTATGTHLYADLVWLGEGGPGAFLWTVDGGDPHDSGAGTAGAYQDLAVSLFSGLSDGPHAVIIEALTDRAVFDDGRNAALTPNSFTFKLAGAAPTIAGLAVTNPGAVLAAPLAATNFLPSTLGNPPRGAFASGVFTQTLPPAPAAQVDAYTGRVWAPPSTAVYSLNLADHVTACLDMDLGNAQACVGIYVRGLYDVYFFKGLGNQVGLFTLGGLTSPPLVPAAAVTMDLAQARWMRIVDALYQVSPDGTTWSTIAVHSRAYPGDPGGSQQAGFFNYNPHGASGDSVLTVSSFHAVKAG